jgi:hypothetical protein
LVPPGEPLHRRDESAEKKIMSKTNDTSKLACTTQDRELRDYELASRALAENELAHVSGGVFTVTAHMRRIFAKL